MSFVTPFFGPSSPFFDGSFGDPRSIPFTVHLDGQDYPIDLNEYRHNGVARFRQGVSTSGEINDQLLNSEGSWWRYRFSWHLGAGQEIDELDEKSQAARYEASRGVNVWDKYQACLHRDVEPVLEVTAADIFMVSTGTYVYVSDGTGVKRSADLVTWNSITGLAGTVQGMCTDGSSVYIATSTNMYTVASALAASLTSSAVAPSGGYAGCAFVSNRLIASNENKIGELTATTFDIFYTHFQSAFRWFAIFNVGSRIYVGGYAGNRSELYSLTTDDAGALIRSAEAASFFSGELLVTALSYGGTVILGTNKGIRFAQLGSDATLTYGPLIDDFGGCTSLAAEGRFVWAGVENYPGGSASGTVRLALDEFTNILQPAYAADEFTTAVSDDIEAVARFGGKTLFAVTSDFVYATDLTAYVTEGWLTSGDITFGTVEDKSISEIRVQYRELDVGETVTVTLADQDDTTIGTKTDAVDGSTEMTLSVVGNDINRAGVTLTLRGDGTSTPCVRQWRLRAYPNAPAVEEWLVPLIIHSHVTVNASEGEVLSMSPWDETARLRQAWQDQSIVLYKEGDHSFFVRIDNFQINTANWRDGSDYFELTCTVRLLST